MTDDRKLDEAKKVLLEQAKALDLKVDQRWSVDTLAEKVQEAQADASADKSAAIKAKADTWVTLLRDAFPVEDEKHLAGETIRVPKAMAEYWYENNVARPGKAPADD
jgi:hypothetical protein